MQEKLTLQKSDQNHISTNTSETQGQTVVYPNAVSAETETTNTRDALCVPRYTTQPPCQVLPFNNNYITDPTYDVTKPTGLLTFPDSTYLTPSRGRRQPETSYSRFKTLCPKESTTTSGPSEDDSDRSCEEEELIDVVNDTMGTSRSDASGKETDSSMSTQSSASESPSAGSHASSSPEQPMATPGSTDTSKAKKRTNYSPSQVQALEKVFHENPYPEPETMEEMSRDLGIAESKIKVWFQNKRARWRKRVQEDKRTFPYDTRAFPSPFMSPLSPVMSPIASYGFMPGSPMFGSPSSPSQVVPGHMMPFPRPPTSPNSPLSNSPLANQKQSSTMTSTFQQRPQLPGYFYTYPFGMYHPPYFCG